MHRKLEGADVMHYEKVYCSCLDNWSCGGGAYWTCTGHSGCRKYIPGGWTVVDPAPVFCPDDPSKNNAPSNQSTWSNKTFRNNGTSDRSTPWSGLNPGRSQWTLNVVGELSDSLACHKSIFRQVAAAIKRTSLFAGIYVYDRIADDRIILEKPNDRMGIKW